jgi:hypothetical protein
MTTENRTETVLMIAREEAHRAPSTTVECGAESMSMSKITVYIDGDHVTLEGSSIAGDHHAAWRDMYILVSPGPVREATIRRGGVEIAMGIGRTIGTAIADAWRKVRA